MAKRMVLVQRLNSLQPGVTFLYPLKTSENLQHRAKPSCNGLIHAFIIRSVTQLTFTPPKSTTEILEGGVKHIQS